MYRRILVPVDGSVASLKGLDEAIKVAKATDAKLKLVNVVNELVIDSAYAPTLVYASVIDGLRASGKKALAAAESVARERGVVAELELIERIGGHAADSIVEVAQAWAADLIVMGTHGRRGLRRLALGSDAELVLRRSNVPVLLVRSAAEA
jgi:nucleotide-binding universal stress UspA family protein